MKRRLSVPDGASSSPRPPESSVGSHFSPSPMRVGLPLVGAARINRLQILYARQEKPFTVRAALTFDLILLKPGLISRRCHRIARCDPNICTVTALSAVGHTFVQIMGMSWEQAEYRQPASETKINKTGNVCIT